MTTIAVHQPNYLPYFGFFSKMNSSDIFVIYDDAQFVKNDYHHRNRIRIYNGWKWLTVPVEKKYIPIKDIRINNDYLWKGMKWPKIHLKEISDNYINCPHFTKYESEITNIYNTTYDKLIDLNMDLIYFLMNAFNINTKIVFASELDFTSASTKRLVDIVDELDGDVYLSGSGGRDYLDVTLFEENGITVEFQDLRHPIYQQSYKDFVDNLSAIDTLFNVGSMPKSDSC